MRYNATNTMSNPASSVTRQVMIDGRWCTIHLDAYDIAAEREASAIRSKMQRLRAVGVAKQDTHDELWSMSRL